MTNKLLLLNKNHTDTLMEQTKTKPQEALGHKMEKQIEFFTLSPPINLDEEGSWKLVVTSFEAGNTVFKKTDENFNVTIFIRGYWYSRGGEESMARLWELLGLRAQKDIELHVTEIKKRGNHIEIRDKDKKFFDHDTGKNEIIEELKNVE